VLEIDPHRKKRMAHEENPTATIALVRAFLDKKQ
jgi:hypothetical protein